MTNNIIVHEATNVHVPSHHSTSTGTAAGAAGGEPTLPAASIKYQSIFVRLPIDSSALSYDTILLWRRDRSRSTGIGRSGRSAQVFAATHTPLV